MMGEWYDVSHSRRDSPATPHLDNGRFFCFGSPTREAAAAAAAAPAAAAAAAAANRNT